MQPSAAQLSLFGRDAPRFDASLARLERRDLGHGAWIDLARGWLGGHASLFDSLARALPWRSDERTMYERVVDVPRLYAGAPPAGAHPEIEAMRRALDAHYRTSFERVTFALYRDGRDSVAWHGDYVARERLEHTLVATVSVGAPRRFLLRPKGGGRSVGCSLGWGDLIVMGGTCQRTWEHSIPKVAHADPRIAIMFRPAWPAERPDDVDRAPRHDR
ncbi:MAG: alpha-ketoglutarate-dependent dioxygenase AlkB [Polyangiales bacterium]